MLPILKQKTCKLLVYRLMRFCFVDKRIEISNLELLADMENILGMEVE
jgi:hypothetical protein